MLLRIRLLVLGTVAVALSSLAMLVRLGPPTISASVAAPVAAFAIVAVIAYMLDYAVNSGLAGSVRGSVITVPFLASAMLVPAWPSALSVAVVTLGVHLVRRREPAKIAFNVSQHTAGVAIGILAIRIAYDDPVVAGTPASYAAVLLIFAVFKIVNTASVSAVVAATEDRRFLPTWASNTFTSGTLGYDLLSAALILSVVWMYQRFGVGAALGLVLPLLGLRELYKVYSQLEKANQELLELMVAAVEARDPYTSGHSIRVAQNAKIIAQILRLPALDVRRIEIAALLHDVGKIHEVFATILQKPGRLTDEENALMQTHAVKSEELVAKVTQFKDLLPAVRHHHENWDGTGYPDRIAREDIPLAARIIMVADTIDAMTSDRPYRKALDAAAVRQELIKWRGKQFDPAICDVVLRSPRYGELFKHSPHQSLPHTQEMPKVRIALNS